MANTMTPPPKNQEPAKMTLTEVTAQADDALVQFDAIAEAVKAGDVVLAGLDQDRLHNALRQVAHALEAVMDLTFTRSEQGQD